MHKRGNDAQVASRLAARLGVSNVFYPLDLSKESFGAIIDRFLSCGEGRIDKIAGYTDGFQLWRNLFDEGVEGVLRGDEAFGWVPAGTPSAVRRVTGCGLCTDYANLGRLIDQFDLPAQEVPAELMRQSEESLETWRDRLYQVYRIPTRLAALSDLKLPYMEVINPFLFRRVLQQTRSIPDQWRTNKSLFKEVVNTVSPPLTYAKADATENVRMILKQKGAVEFLKHELTKGQAANIFPSSFLDHLLGGIHTDGSDKRNCAKLLKKGLRQATPKTLFKKWQNGVDRLPNLDSNLLAFRVVLVGKMHDLLTQDAQRLSPS